MDKRQAFHKKRKMNDHKFIKGCITSSVNKGNGNQYTIFCLLFAPCCTDVCSFTLCVCLMHPKSTNTHSHPLEKHALNIYIKPLHKGYANSQQPIT